MNNVEIERINNIVEELESTSYGHYDIMKKLYTNNIDYIKFRGFNEIKGADYKLKIEMFFEIHDTNYILELELYYTSPNEEWYYSDTELKSNFYEGIGSVHYSCLNDKINIFDYILASESLCQWYPDTLLLVRSNVYELMKKNIRAKDIRQVYIFRGKPGIGKTYIADKIDENIFETDNHPLYEIDKMDEIYENIIVIGNRYSIPKGRFEEEEIPYNDLYNKIKSKIKGKVNIINVDFK